MLLSSGARRCAEIRDLPSDASNRGEQQCAAPTQDPHKDQQSFTHPPFSALALTGWSVAAVCAAAASILVAPGLSGVFAAGLAITMIAIAAIDARRFLIPNKLVLAALALGFVGTALQNREAAAAAVAHSALRGTALFVFFFLFRMGYHRIRGREGLGLGDVKLAAVAGTWLGWLAAGFAIDIAALSALAYVFLGVFSGKRQVTATTRIPFGLFFAPAIWLAWLLSALFQLGA